MKLILSRKGFDASAGGVASPILPDGRMFSLPIPSKHAPMRYRDIHLCDHALGQVVPALTEGRTRASSGAHLDPDLVASAVPRQPGWRGLFGQAGAAQTILATRGVGPGDVFLFFGWFRRAEHHGRGLRYVARAPDLHVLWGWLAVGCVVDLVTAPLAAIPAWATYHPHLRGMERMTANALYVAADRLVLDGVDTGLPGAGVWDRYDDRLRLTKRGQTRSRWSLPAWFHPGGREPGRGRPPLGLHANPARWRRADDRVELQNVGRGQEFVLDIVHYPEAVAWIREIVTINAFQ